VSATQVTVGLDVGTTKVCAVVAEVDNGDVTSILGVGACPCDGLERGVVVNLEATTQAVTDALRSASQSAGISIKNVMAGIAGEHVRSFQSTGVIGVSRKDREIHSDDLQRVLEHARAYPIPGDRQLLHCLPRDFTVDEQRGIRDPLGMSGVRLEAEVHIVTVHSTAVQNLLRAITRAGVQVDALILESLASARAVVEDDEAALGVLLLDIGGGTTDVAVYERGSVRHTAVLGYGGKAITNDIAVVLHTSLDQAERLKLEHGAAIAARVAPHEEVEVAGVGGREPKRVTTQVVASIIEPRAEEIFALARAEVERVLDPSLLKAGVVLTGGTAALRGLTELAERTLGLPARVGVPTGLKGVTDWTADPRMSAAVGLVLYGAAEGRTRRVGTNLLDRVRRPFREWFREHL